jgi:kinesin family protein 4/21/27
MQNKIGEFEKLRDKEQTNLMQNNDNEDELNSNEPADKDYALRQAQMQFQLGEFDTELMKKQYLHQKMIENLTQLSSKDTKLESNMDELKSRIDSLEKEKEDLMDQIRTSDRK